MSTSGYVTATSVVERAHEYALGMDERRTWRMARAITDEAAVQQAWADGTGGPANMPFRGICPAVASRGIREPRHERRLNTLYRLEARLDCRRICRYYPIGRAGRDVRGYISLGEWVRTRGRLTWLRGALYRHHTGGI